MKTIGLIGGIGPESTVDYYKRIITAFQEHNKGAEYPEIIVYSAKLNELMAMLENRQWNDLTEWLLEKVNALRSAGEFAAIGSNSPHVVFEDVAARSPIPLLSIVEETCRKAEKMGLQRPGLMGIQFTMESDFYQKVFQRSGMSVVVPDEKDRQFIHHKLFSEIELGIIKDSTREELLAIVKKMKDRDSIDSLILGCTELPLILDKDAQGIPFLNTTSIHVDAMVRYSLGEISGSNPAAR